MDVVERLLAISDIEPLKARYFRLVDAKQWDEWAQLFTADAVTDFSTLDPNLVFRGRAAMLAATAGTVGRIVRTIHHGHTPEIEVLDSASARGVWAMTSCRFWPEGEERTADFKETTRWAYYRENYIKTGEGWRICYLRLEPLHFAAIRECDIYPLQR